MAKKKKCDREHCSKKVWRGVHTCEGYSFLNLGYYFGRKDKPILICPCSCHAGISDEKSYELAQKELKTRTQ